MVATVTAAQRGGANAVVARVVGGRVVGELMLGGDGAGHGAHADAGDVGGEGEEGRTGGAGGARGGGHLGAGHAACCESFHLRDSVCRVRLTRCYSFGEWCAGVWEYPFTLASGWHCGYRCLFLFTALLLHWLDGGICCSCSLVSHDKVS